MKVVDHLRGFQQRVQARIALIELLRWLPWLVVLALLCRRLSSLQIAVAVSIGLCVLLSLWLRHRLRQIDRPWLIRQLDSGQRGLQDSSDLLFSERADLQPLQQLQQRRVQQTLLAGAAPDLRPAIAWRSMIWGALAAFLVGLLIVLWRPAAQLSTESAATIDPTTLAPSIDQSMQATVLITPPSYTGLAEREITSLDADVAQDSTLRWSLQFTQLPSAVRLSFVDGEELDLQRDGDQWLGERAFESSTLYRIEIEGAEPIATVDPYRIEVRADQPPKLTISEPQRTLTVLDAQTRTWQLRFEASDDYGLGTAQLQLTLAQGRGEQVTVSERRVTLRGSGDALTQTFDHRIDVATMGFARGDDLIARIEVRDLRQPEANVSRSASFILRWPPEPASDGSGVEGLVQQTLPAYFRSQRQIIIDTQALIAERGQLSADEFVDRSDAIGADQRILRMRYGQFLGEESEGYGDDDHGHEDGEHSDEDHGEDDHDDAAPETASARELMAAAGHLHDIPEAATLLDPATKRLLRAALDAMWQSERELRVGAPTKALPHENRALDNIKRVQQASRIYLARVGLELPEIDSARRLTGDRPDGRTRVDPLTASENDSLLPEVWQALRGDQPPPLDDLAKAISSMNLTGAERLDLLAGIDALRRSPDCTGCRQRLADLLWPKLQPPAAAPPVRERIDASGRAYFDALSPARVAQ